jgi:carbon-monoxide dehydrogenase large subunit
MESVARECLMDIAARGLGIDPLEFRRRNVISLADCPFQTVTGVVYEDVSPSETIEQAVAMLDYEGFRREQRAARGEGRYLGVGISSYVEPTSMGLGAIGTEVAQVRVEPTGAVTAVFGTASHGQGLETTLAQVVADNLGVDVEDVTVLQGDTAVAPFGGGTGGSRSAVMGGAAGRLAALELRAKVLDLAAHVLEAAVDDLELELGRVRVRGTPTKSVALRDLAARAFLGAGQLPAELSAGLEASVRFVPPMFTFSNATHVCTCEVDIRTGRVTLLRYIVSEDCGVMINPMVVEGQIAGGVVQGLGGVLLENMVYDEVGNPSTTTLLDYLVPTAADVPLIEYGHVVTPSKNPGGHKGMGEGGNIGSPAAVINAIGDALSPFGVVVTRQPLTADRILDLLEAARDRERTAAPEVRVEHSARGRMSRASA